MKKIGRIVATLLTITLILSLLAACGGGGNTPGSSPDASPDAGTNSGSGQSSAPDGASAEPTDTTLVYGTTQKYNYFNPYGGATGAYYFMSLVFDRLWEVDKETTEVTSRIFSSYEWEDDVTLKCVLKPGIIFNDGTEAKGEDVIYSLQKSIIDGDNFSYYTSKVDYDKSYVGDDGMTAYIVFLEPYGAAVNIFAQVPLVSKAFCDAHPNNDPIWWSDPVGSGPYRIIEAVTDDSAVYARRDDYWNSDYSFEVSELTVKHYSDGTAMWVDLQNGVIDVALPLSATQAGDLVSNPGEFTLATQSLYDVPVLVLRETNEYLSDIRVREAIAYAIDFDSVAAITFGELSAPANSHFTSDFACYNNNQPYEYNADRAKQVLADAGYAEGEIMLDFIAVNDGFQHIVAEAVQGYLGAIGITVNVQTYDPGTAIPMLIGGEADLAYFGVSNGNPEMEPDQFFSAFAGNGSFKTMAIQDEYFNSLLDRALVSVDQNERAELYRQADAWMYENFYALPICEKLEGLAYNSRIESIDIISQGKGCLGDVTFAK